MPSDEKWMRRALALAERGRGSVHPNPMVGAVLVRNGRGVGEGYHARFGELHAEADALRKAGRRADGATLYVNLEPCAHWGKTSPCVDAIVRAGIKRVVAGMRDPNPLVSGKGFRFLNRQGVQVKTGVLEAEARQLNRAFIAWMTQKRPYVTLKAASSLDGRAATLTGESKWITGAKARMEGHRLRAQVDAVAVGTGTILRDNPSLSAHGRGRDPVRVIFDSRLRSPLGAQVFKGRAPTWCLATDRTLLKRMDQLKRKGVQVLLSRADSQGRVAVHDALRRLAERGVAHLLVEGGPTLQQSFLEAGMVDEVIWFIAPVIIGNAKHLKNAQRLGDLDVKRIGKDFLLRGRIVNAASPQPSPYGRGRQR